MTFLTNGIQPLQHRWKTYIDNKEENVEKLTTFDQIQWEYLGQSMNFSANPVHDFYYKC